MLEIPFHESVVSDRIGIIALVSFPVARSQFNLDLIANYAD